MLTLTIDLLAARYHATPFGRAANEGEPEWPPSPWRIGRALVSAWWRMPLDERGSPDTLDRILRALTDPPVFRLPQGTQGHSRHYMPKTDGVPTLVLDPFVRTDDSPVDVCWERVELDAGDSAALEDLLSRVGYLGRAESVALLGLAATTHDGGIAVAPFEEEADHDGEVVQVLCLSEDASVQSLSESTAERRRRRRLDPPGGTWIGYFRPRAALEPPRPPAAERTRPAVQVLRFAVEGPALPVITDAIRLTERYRAAVLSRADRKPSQVIAALRGRVDGKHAPGGHVHSHYLATDEDDDGHIDHLTVWCPRGLVPDAIDALDFPTLTSWAFDHPVRLLLLETLDRDDIERRRPALGPLAVAMRWRSHTPFLPPRHPKRRGGKLVDTYEQQLRLELERRGFPEPSGLRPIARGRKHWGAFRRERRGAQARADLPALGFEIEFAEPVAGPISLGRNSHFGMGLFLPA